MRKQRNYDKRVRLTRVLLNDYLVLKSMSVQAGISMAEALHKLITRQLEPSSEEIMPLLAYLTRGITKGSAKGSTAIATDGGRVAAFRIKHGGIRHE
ncbi:hypothetical protein ES703_114869 [subsurface metagenome]